MYNWYFGFWFFVWKFVGVECTNFIDIHITEARNLLLVFFPKWSVKFATLFSRIPYSEIFPLTQYKIFKFLYTYVPNRSPEIVLIIIIIKITQEVKNQSFATEEIVFFFFSSCILTNTIITFCSIMFSYGFGGLMLSSDNPPFSLSNFKLYNWLWWVIERKSKNY